MRLDDLRAKIKALREMLRDLTASLDRLCEFLLIRWPLYLLLCLIFAAACFLPPLSALVGMALPGGFLWTLVAALTALPVLLPLVYMLHPLPPSPGWRFSQQPLSTLGKAEVIMADTSLLTDGQQETLIALPLEPTAELRKRPEAFFLSVAIAYTAKLQNEETRAVLMNAAATLGVSLDNLTRLKPIVGQTQLGPIPGVIVSDGKGQSSYFVGDPIALSELCASIDGQHPRPLIKEDRERVRAVTQSLRQEGALALGFGMLEADAEGPVYLGLLSMRDVVSEDAAAAVRALLEAGYNLQAQPIDERFEPPMRLAALRQRLGLTNALYAPQVILSTDLIDTQALCIAATDHRHRRFDAPILLAREWFGKVASWLRIALGTALGLLLSLLLGPANPLCLLAAMALICVSLLSAGSDDSQWDAAGLTLLAVALPLRLFLFFAQAVSSGAAIGMYAIVAAWALSLHLARRSMTILACALMGLLFVLMSWLLTGLAPLGALLAFLAGLLAGVLAGQLLRMN